MRAPRIALATLSACLALAAAACGGATHAAAHRVTPPKAAELGAVPGSPGAFVRQPVSPSMTPNPDPRGPCGARLTQPPFTADGLTVYASQAGTEVFVWSRRLARQTVQDLIDAISADIRPGCPRFLSHTPYAHDQVNEFLGAVALPELGDQRVAFATRARQDAPGSAWAYAAEAFVRRDDRLSAVMVVSTTRVDDGFVRGVVGLAAR